MKILWDLKKGFVKDLLDHYPDPKPHYNTVSSLVRLLEEKGFIGHKAFGNTHEYFPLVPKEEYRKSSLSQLIGDYFSNSYKDVVSYFLKEEKLSEEEIIDLIKTIKNNK